MIERTYLSYQVIMKGFPHAIWEAAARRVPIITTKVGGIPGLVSDRMVTFIDTKDVSSIVSALESVLTQENTEVKEKTKLIWDVARKYRLENCAQMLINHLEN